MGLSLALRGMLITLLKIWTGYLPGLPSTGLPIRLVRNLNQQKPEKRRNRKRRETREGLQLQITEGKAHVLYLGPWEEHPLKTTMNQRFMGYCNCSGLRKKLCLKFVHLKTDKACLRDLLHSNCFFWRSS